MQDFKDKTKAQLLREIKKLSRKYAKLKAEFYQNRDKLWNIVEFLPNAIFETDMSGKAIFANAAGLEIFGRTSEDLRKGFTAFDVIIPEEHERLRAGFQRVMSGELYPPVPYTGFKKDGARFPVAIQSSRVMKNGKVVGVRGVIIDITKIQQAADMAGEGFHGHIFCFIQGDARGDATGKIRERYAVVALGFFMDDGDVAGHDGLLKSISTRPVSLYFSTS